MSSEMWRQALRAVQPLAAAAARRFPSLRLVVYDGVDDPVTVQRELGEVQSVELHGVNIGHTLWARRFSKDRSVWGQLAFREHDGDGAGECHRLFEVAGSYLVGSKISRGSILVECPWEFEESFALVRVMLAFGNDLRSFPLLRWKRVRRQLGDRSAVHVLIGHPLLACAALVEALDASELARLPTADICAQYRQVFGSRLLDLATQDVATESDITPFHPEDVARVQSLWTEHEVASSAARQTEDHWLLAGADSDLFVVQERASQARAKFLDEIDELANRYAALTASDTQQGALQDDEPDSEIENLLGVSREYHHYLRGSTPDEIRQIVGALERIPSDLRSRPMGAAEAARYYGLSEKASHPAREMQSLVPHARLSRQMFVWHLGPFPKEVREEMRG